jgi:indolepyruvate ferredoxin oxidoreductase alpha subunit
LLGKHGFIVSGDIGCYTLGVLPPFNAMDTCIDMGASITVAQGMEIALGSAHTQKVAAVIGDSTFAHSGITGLVNAAYNKRNSLIIVLDNSTTAMTGMQPNPLSGERITGEPAVQLDYRKIAEAVGISSENFVVVDAYHEKVIEEALLRCAESKKLSMIVVKSQCIVLKARKAKRKI